MCDAKQENGRTGADTPQVRPDEGIVVHIAGWLPEGGRHFVWFDDAAVMAVSPELATATVKAVSDR